MELSELVQRIRRGDREALRELIAEYGAGVYRKAYQKTRDKDLAREATRRTFAQLVTTLQEQTDMDGWELWLNALTKRNIEACSNLRADMAFMESELTRELFSDPSPAAQLTDGGQAHASVADFWQEGPFAVQHPDAALAQELAARQTEAQRLAQQQAAAQYAAQQQAAAQYAAQQQAAAQYAAQQQAAAQHTPDRAAEQPHAAARTAQRRGRKQARLFEEDVPVEDRPGAGTPAVILLALLCAILVWIAAGISMSLNLLPKIDLGYTWFNANIAQFF